MPILTFINTVLQSYVLVLDSLLDSCCLPRRRSSGAQPSQRFGALNMISALGPFIMKHPQVKDSMEQFMLQHVLPEFKAPEPYLRSIVCTNFHCVLLSTDSY